VVILVTMGSFLIEGAQLRDEILSVLLETIPSASRSMIEKNLVQILESRGSVGLFGALGLVWSSTAAFSMLSRNINRAWPDVKPRNMLKTRLTAFIAVLAVFGLILTLMMTEALLGAMESLQAPGALGKVLSPTIALTSRLLMDLFAFFAFVLMYRWIPNATVRWREAAVGALGATIFAFGLSQGFSWYLKSGLVKYNLVYGSLGTIVSFLLWTLGMAFVVLFGAHLTASWQQSKE
jgi:membrane protein